MPSPTRRGSDHALKVLEFDRVLARVAERASCEMARERVLSLAPSHGLEAVRRELARVGATMRFVEEKPAWGLPAIPDARAALHHLAAEGAVLEPLQVHALGTLLGASRLVAVELDGRESRPEELSTIRACLVQDRRAEEAVAKAVDPEGRVLDTASKELKRIRDRLRGAHARIVVSDASVSIREGRYVIPIRREGRGEVGGIVHDESHTGATLFVEPPVAIELMNQLRDLERDEAREIRRVLGALTERLQPLRDGMAGALDALVDFDALLARARTAHAWRASLPEVLDAGASEFRIVEARHPLLVEAGDRPVVPFDLEVFPGERAIVVSGPNTGGKSVFLKTAGLISTLTQAGVVPPVGPGTRLPAFSSFFADIGDEQSIAQSLSTFSAHLANLSEIVRGADARALVLIDEMGTGTDPAEGAALARAILEVLVERGSFTVVSSHLGELKRLAVEGSGIVNASLQFDPDRMEPTYHLVKGRPGRSYGLAIARRLGFPPDVLDRAEGHQEGDEVRMEELLERLERRERDSAASLRDLEAERAHVAGQRADLEARERALRESERSARERGREEARKLLMNARLEVEEAITALRAEIRAGAELEEAARQARRHVERAASGVAGKVPRGSTPVTAADVGVGDAVRVHASGAQGRVIELRDSRALVEVGALRMELSLADLEPMTAGAPAPEGDARRGGWSGPPVVQVRTEVDLRGLRVDEIEVELFRALDEAVLEDLSDLRVIHGKGTGALRQRVGELLSGDPRVASYRMGSPREGGAGVTVVILQ